MDYGQLLSRSWEIIWNNKFLIILGVLVALGGGGGSGSPNFNTSGFQGGNVFEGAEGFNPEEFNPEDLGLSEAELEEAFGDLAPMLAGVGALLVAFCCIAFIVGIALWVVGNIARGGLIAGVNEIETVGASSFKQAWSAGWQKGWRLLGIGLIPAIPGIVLALVVAALAAAAIAGTQGLDPTALASAGAGMIMVLVCTLCLVMLVSLVLSVLRVLANRACMLEDTGVFESYQRGWAVLRDNLGEGVLLVLIQIGISIGIGIVMIIPSLIMAICCFLLPVLWVINGAVSAFFSTAWTLAWTQWTGAGKGIVIEQAPSV
jgi:hypothetical protein